MNTGINAGIYVPQGPYVFQTGKHKDECVELLMFKNYSFLIFLLRKLNAEERERKNRLHLHLEWIIKRGETRKPKMLCPGCHQRPVKEFSALESRYDLSFGQIYTCCENEECKESLASMAADRVPKFYPFKFSVLRSFRYEVDRKQVIWLFRTVFDLPCPPKPITREQAFLFFSS